MEMVKFVISGILVLFAYGALADEKITYPLPNTFISAIKHDYPTLRLPKSKDMKGYWTNYVIENAPYITSGDYNCDGRSDIAVILVSDTNEWSFAIYHGQADGQYIQGYPEKSFTTISGKDNLPTTHAISTQERQTPWQYSATEAGPGYQAEHTETYTFKCDAVQFDTFELSSSAIYWDGKKYEEISYGE